MKGILAQLAFQNLHYHIYYRQGRATISHQYTNDICIGNIIFGNDRVDFLLWWLISEKMFRLLLSVPEW